MHLSTRPWRLLLAATLTAGTVTGAASHVAIGAKKPADRATPGIACDAGSRPESMQGRAPQKDFDSGRAKKGYFCNAREISHFGHSGGYRVERYVDAHQHECAFYDTTLLFPKDVAQQAGETSGTYVMDMSDPRHPVHTDTLRTAAFQTPHESVRLNAKRGLIAADMANPAFHPGFVDIFSVKNDCRHPEFMASLPVGILGHESGFAPDGKTFYVSSLYGHTLAAIDVSNPRTPTLLWASYAYSPHGMSVSNDGNRLYIAEAAFSSGFSGLTVLDVSQIQKRVFNPEVPVVSRLTWPNVSTPQNATPFVRGGHKYLLETDEFGSGANIGAARIIDIDNEKKPYVVSNLRLAVNLAQNQKKVENSDPGNDQEFQGYQAHYCTLPSRIDPNIVACSFILSGLRVFDIRDVAHPREIAYFNKPLLPSSTSVPPGKAGSFAMSAPAYDQASHDIWYSDGNTGFYVVRLTKAAGVSRFAKRVLYPGN